MTNHPKSSHKQAEEVHSRDTEVVTDSADKVRQEIYDRLAVPERERVAHNEVVARELKQIADWVDPAKNPMPRDVTWTDLANRLRRIAVYRPGEQSQAACWHCGTVLAVSPIYRCERCPDECDDEKCGAMGCRDRTALPDQVVAVAEEDWDDINIERAGLKLPPIRLPDQETGR